MKNLTIEATAKIFNVPVERIKEQYLANANGLQKMYEKAIKTGKKVNGYTADQLKNMASAYFKKAS